MRALRLSRFVLGNPLMVHLKKYVLEMKQPKFLLLVVGTFVFVHLFCKKCVVEGISQAVPNWIPEGSKNPAFVCLLISQLRLAQVRFWSNGEHYIKSSTPSRSMDLK